MEDINEESIKGTSDYSRNENEVPVNPISSYKSMYEEPTYINGDAVKPANNMTLAIIATVASVITGCCGLVGCFGLIIGIIAIVFASQVDSKFRIGDFNGAESSAKNSKTLSFVAIGLSIVSVIVWLILLSTGAFQAYINELQNM